MGIRALFDHSGDRKSQHDCTVDCVRDTKSEIRARSLLTHFDYDHGHKRESYDKTSDGQSTPIRRICSALPRLPAGPADTNPDGCGMGTPTITSHKLTNLAREKGEDVHIREFVQIMNDTIRDMKAQTPVIMTVMSIDFFLSQMVQVLIRRIAEWSSAPSIFH